MTAMSSRRSWSRTTSRDRSPLDLIAVPALALTLGTPTDLADARHLRDVLLASARDLVNAIGHDPDRGNCASAGCALATGTDETRCGLVHRLARVEEGTSSAADVRRALLAFDAALARSVDAVRRCRQIEHGMGHCWFSTLPGGDGCGEVLRAAHRLG